MCCARSKVSFFWGEMVIPPSAVRNPLLYRNKCEFRSQIPYHTIQFSNSLKFPEPFFSKSLFQHLQIFSMTNYIKPTKLCFSNQFPYTQTSVRPTDPKSIKTDQPDPKGCAHVHLGVWISLILLTGQENRVPRVGLTQAEGKFTPAKRFRSDVTWWIIW